ncbi:MAG: DUF3310 domain-containing protein [Leptolyngbya sp. Prado105]|nr:DUF3310 domain-containing protein [Leptolyngbya sp. Prado105]
MTEQINHPTHYQGAAKATRHILETLCVPTELLDGECIDAIEYVNAGFHTGNAIKYLWRCGQKGDVIQDLEKAVWYLERWAQISLGKSSAIVRDVRKAANLINQLIQQQREVNRLKAIEHFNQLKPGQR